MMKNSKSIYVMFLYFVHKYKTYKQQSEVLPTSGAQLFTSLKADLCQDMNGGFAYSRCHNGTFP